MPFLPGRREAANLISDANVAANRLLAAWRILTFRAGALACRTLFDRAVALQPVFVPRVWLSKSKCLDYLGTDPRDLPEQNFL